MKKAFALYVFDSQRNDYVSFVLKIPYKKLKEIISRTLEGGQSFLQNHYCYCNQETIKRLGFDFQISSKPAFIKQIVFDNPLFYCTFCFQTHCGIYFFNFTLCQDQYQGKLLKILRNLQNSPFILLNKEEVEYLLKVIAPKRLSVNSLNLASISKLLEKSFNHFVCLSHHFKKIPHIAKIISKNQIASSPYYWFLYISNKDCNDTHACNLLLDKDISPLSQNSSLDEKTHIFLDNQQILQFATNEIFEIGDGDIEVALTTFDFQGKL